MLSVKKMWKNRINGESQKEGLRLESSYMVESVIVLPLFVTFMTALLFFFRVLQVQQQVDNALILTGRELSVAAYQSQLEKVSDNSLSAELVLQKNLKKCKVSEKFVRNGSKGISLLRSDFKGSYITLTADYQMQIPVILLGKHKISITQQVKCRKWTGRRKDDTSSESEEEIVYITLTGTAYHKNRDCTYLKPKVKSILVSEIKDCRSKDGSKYYACSRCKRQKGKKVVYVTDYGNRYHSSKNCSEIQRTVYTVFLSEAGDRHGCSKCSM